MQSYFMHPTQRMTDQVFINKYLYGIVNIHWPDKITTGVLVNSHGEKLTRSPY